MTILNHSIVPTKNYKQALQLCQDIDPDDTPFVAFSLFLKTGDKKLIQGLSQKGFKKIITTNDLFEDFLRRNKRKK